VVSEGLFFRGNKKERAFRQLLRDKNAYVSPVIEDAFRSGFNSASVRVRLIAINADGSPFPFDSDDWERPGLDTNRDDNSAEETEQTTAVDITAPAATDEGTRLLEMEAEAELELLRMRVESERRRRQRGMGSLPGPAGKLQQLRQKAWALNSKWQVSDFK